MLTTLEIVLGIDNIIVITILSGDLPPSDQRRGRRLGLGLAMITRVLLLLTLTWMTRLVAPLFAISGHAITGKGLVLVLGGAYLIWKAINEIHETVELTDKQEGHRKKRSSLAFVVVQIILIDIVFSLDSVITAVGMSNEILIMVIAVIAAVCIMLFASDAISTFVNKHASVKVLALAFILVVGIVLVIDGLAPEFAERYYVKNYAYAAMAFSVLVELLNLRMRRNERRLNGD
jgi:predicted tellurium resistance membrane protein TerC